MQSWFLILSSLWMLAAFKMLIQLILNRIMILTAQQILTALLILNVCLILNLYLLWMFTCFWMLSRFWMLNWGWMLIRFWTLTWFWSVESDPHSVRGDLPHLREEKGVRVVVVYGHQVSIPSQAVEQSVFILHPVLGTKQVAAVTVRHPWMDAQAI